MSLFSFNQLWIALKKQWNEAVTTFEPLLPATPADPSNKFLDGNKAWSAITGFEPVPTTTTVTLSVAGWSGGLSQVATVTGSTATNRLRFRLPSSDAEIMEIASKQVRPTPSTQTTDSLTFVATKTPTVEIVMVCEILPAL